MPMVDRMRPWRHFLDAVKIEVGAVTFADGEPREELGLLLAEAADDQAKEAVVLVYRFDQRSDVEDLVDELRRQADLRWPAS